MSRMEAGLTSGNGTGASVGGARTPPTVMILAEVTECQLQAPPTVDLFGENEPQPGGDGRVAFPPGAALETCDSVDDERVLGVAVAMLPGGPCDVLFEDDVRGSAHVARLRNASKSLKQYGHDGVDRSGARAAGGWEA